MYLFDKRGSMHDTGCLELVHWEDPEGEAFETRFRNRGEKGMSNYPADEMNRN